MTDKLDNNAPLVGITEDDSRPTPSEQDTLLGRIIDPQPLHNAAAERGDVPGLVTGFVDTLTGRTEGGDRDPDADKGTTDNSQA